jgi:hypothetical protein
MMTKNDAKIQRDEIISAFLAKYGVGPERVMQVQDRGADGLLRWYVRHMNEDEVAMLKMTGAWREEE